MKLAAYMPGRDNNFHLIRILAAYAVLVSHSFVLSTGDVRQEPFASSLGVTVGSIAVDVFFLTSGLLVTGSLLTKRDLREFVWARILRIFPALLVMLVLTVFVMGPFLSQVSWLSYFTDSASYRYFVKSATLITGMGRSLPGLFEHNPFPQSVNGSLWTLKIEIRMYAMLGLLWFISSKIPSLGDRSFKIATLLLAGMSGIIHLASCLGYLPYRASTHLFFMFFLGASLFIGRHHIDMSWRAFWVLTICLFAAMTSTTLFPFVYALVMPYLLMFLAYIPKGFVRHYNSVGDYSYGFYIYAFPVQQALAFCWEGIDVSAMVWVSTLIVLPLAIISWHFIEKPVLDFKNRLVQKTQSVV